MNKEQNSPLSVRAKGEVMLGEAEFKGARGGGSRGDAGGGTGGGGWGEMVAWVMRCHHLLAKHPATKKYQNQGG